MGALEAKQLDFSIVSPKLTVNALRDSGYKDTNHAIAELIDNSVEAGAKLVELIAVETPPEPDKAYARAQVSQIAVADDGEGMDNTTLRRALRFGDGTRLDRSQRGIGRFGVGLPNASISQSRRVDIWTWQNGADNALHCYLDLDEINDGARDVPEANHDPVPDRWRPLAETTSEQSGTLVVWSNLDRVRWRGGEKTLERTEELCGRIYRKFLTDAVNPVEIRLTLAAENDGALEIKGEARACLPTDPLYLMTPSSTPPPFDTTPMFRLFNERTWTVSLDGEEGDIHVRCTMARPDAINEKKSEIPWPKSYAQRQDLPHGANTPTGTKESQSSAPDVNSNSARHGSTATSLKNAGGPSKSNSIQCSTRSSESSTTSNTPTPSSAGAGFEWEEVADTGETIGTFRERLAETSDPRAHLIDVWMWIDEQIKRMRAERKSIMRRHRVECLVSSSHHG